MEPDTDTRRPGRLLAAASLAVAAAIWLPGLHWLFRPASSEMRTTGGISPWARQLAARHVLLWSDPALRQKEQDKMRAANSEWDFMGRSYLTWSLANMALCDRACKPAALTTIDAIVDETLKLEQERGVHFFLMPYGRTGTFVQQPARSQFVDGEIALMLALRCLVEDRADYRSLLEQRVRIMVDRMERSPTLSAESYPDECWTFCNSVALAAIRVHDALSREDHSGLFRRWIAMARQRLIDPASGLLISAYGLDGRRIYGPEGSSIWMVTHCLALIDEPFARAQYDLARKQMGGEILGFGYAREWPRGMDDHMDIDSGLVVPGLGASVASTGLSVIAAAQFGDDEFLARLGASMQLGAFPSRHDGQLRFLVSNQVGDAVVLYALTLGPAWEKVKGVRP